MGFGCSPRRGDHESGGQVRGGYCTCPALLSALLAGQAWSRASFCRIEFHFQPLSGRSHGSLQIFDNEAKYTSESEKAWAAMPNAWERRSRLCGHPHPGPRRGSDPQTSAQLPVGGRPTLCMLPLGPPQARALSPEASQRAPGGRRGRLGDLQGGQVLAGGEGAPGDWPGCPVAPGAGASGLSPASPARPDVPAGP